MEEFGVLCSCLGVGEGWIDSQIDAVVFCTYCSEDSRDYSSVNVSFWD